MLTLIFYSNLAEQCRGMIVMSFFKHYLFMWKSCLVITVVTIFAWFKDLYMENVRWAVLKKNP